MHEEMRREALEVRPCLKCGEQRLSKSWSRICRKCLRKNQKVFIKEPHAVGLDHHTQP